MVKLDLLRPGRGHRHELAGDVDLVGGDIRNAGIGGLVDELDLRRIAEQALGDDARRCRCRSPASSPFSSRKCQGGLVLPVPTMILPRLRTSWSLPCADATCADVTANENRPRPTIVLMVALSMPSSPKKDRVVDLPTSGQTARLQPFGRSRRVDCSTERIAPRTSGADPDAPASPALRALTRGHRFLVRNSDNPPHAPPHAQSGQPHIARSCQDSPTSPAAALI